MTSAILPSHIKESEKIDIKAVKAFVKKQQENKSMAQTWKLDIFLNNKILGLAITQPPKDSAGYKKGLWEYSVSAIILSFVGHPTLEEIGTLPLAYFPTKEKALEAIPYIKIFIKNRYDFDLKYDSNFIKKRKTFF